MARYMRSDLGRGHSYLRPPVVVTTAAGALVWYGPGVKLVVPSEVARRRQRVFYVLKPPEVVTQVAVPIFFGPRVELAVHVQRSSANRSRRQAYSLLSYPVVVEPSITWYGPRQKYAPQALRIKRRPLSHLLPPQVVVSAEEAVFFGPRVVLTNVIARRARTQLHSFLRPPTILATNEPTKVHLALSRRGQPRSELKPPVLIDLRPQVYYLSTTFAPQRRGRPIWHLGPPVVVRTAVELSGPEVTLASSHKGKTRSFLLPPIVVFRAVELSGPETSLVRIRPVKTTARLASPTVIDLSPQVFYLNLTLTTIKHPSVGHVLRPPVVVRGALELSGPEVTLVRIRPARTMVQIRPPAVIDLSPQVFYLSLTTVRITHPPVGHVLRPPIVVFTAVELSGPEVTLTVRRQQTGRARLFPPGVVTTEVVQIFYGPSVHLAKIRPPRVGYDLAAPIIVSVGGALGGTMVSLAPQRRGEPISHLFPPAVITAEERAYFGPQVSLARITPPKSNARLSPPAVVAPVLFSGPITELAPSFRGKPKSSLRKPVVVSQPSAYRQVVPPTLTYSRRGRPTYFLNPPTRVFPFFARKTDITLAPQRRGKPKSFLRKPVVVRLAVEIYGPEITLVRISPPPTISRLRPPTVVIRPVFFGPLVSLAPSIFGRPKSQLTPPAIVKAPFVAEPIHVSLTTITPAPVVSELVSPVVVNDAEAFYGPQIWLVRVKPPKTIRAFVKAHVVEPPFIPPRGKVCGFDIAGSFICYVELPGTKVSGSDQAGSSVQGTSSSSAKVTGSDSAGGGVSGSDNAAE